MVLQFNNEEPLRAQRMTADEARCVIALWQQEQTEQTGLTDKPAVPDVAEGLDISVEDVQRLLQAVRAQRIEAEQALAQEQELSEIRLAEEERQLAEIRRQRAELRREQAEAERRQAPQRQITYSERPSLYTKQDTGSVEYKVGGVVLGIVVYWFFWLMHHPHPPQQIYVSHAAAFYDAQGKVTSVDMTCRDGTGQEVPCDDATMTSEKAYFQDAHDREVADAKKNHDRQTHRGNH